MPSDYVWVHPSMQLAAADDGAKQETTNSAGLQTGKSTVKGSIFSRLGDPVAGGSVKEQQTSSLKLQQETKRKYSPRQVSKWMV